MRTVRAAVWVGLSAAIVLAGCGADERAGAAVRRYASAAHGLSFAYPERLYLLEQHHGDADPTRLSVVLVEDDPANRAYLDGTLEAATEGPPMITVDVFDNPDGLPAADWVAAHTNWILTDKHPLTVRFGDSTYLVYFWDGLYAGKSAIAAAGPFTFVFSVTWISADDALVNAFAALLESARLAPPDR